MTSERHPNPADTARPSLVTSDASRRILVVDDNPAIHDDFRKTLVPAPVPDDLAALEAAVLDTPAPVRGPRPHFEVDTALQGRDAVRMVEAALREGRPYSVIFVDMRMPPGWDGVETIERLWQIDPSAQVVICTAFADYSWEEIASRLHSTDQLLILKKPFDGMEVCQIAAAMCEKWRLQQQARLRVDELEQMVSQRTLDLRRAALHDRLTGLPNRSHLYERIESLLSEHTPAPEHQFALLFIDFDRFKIINDSLGHEVGDKLLIAIADRLYLAVHGPGDPAAAANHLCARLGGDEFVVVLAGYSDHDEITKVATHLLDVFSKPYNIDGHEIQSTASIGATTSLVSTLDREELLRDADTAMYRAKSRGRNRWIFFDRQMHEEAVSRLSLEGDLRRAIDSDQFVLFYQPIIALESGRLAGFEALVRWNHPARGLLRPESFIALAEETGLIIPMTNNLISQACEQLARWTRLGPQSSTLAVNVNLSQRQMCDPSLPKLVAACIERFNLRPPQLKLEITETAIMDDPGRALTIMQAVRELGVRLYMDDFGTGHSSLNCLHRFPLNGLKVDRQFIATVAERRDYTAVVHAIITLAHNLGMRVVAEGVETDEQRTMLHTLDCDDAQGFLFGRAMPPEDVADYIARSLGIARAAA